MKVKDITNLMETDHIVRFLNLNGEEIWHGEVKDLTEELLNCEVVYIWSNSYITYRKNEPNSWLEIVIK